MPVLVVPPHGNPQPERTDEAVVLERGVVVVVVVGRLGRVEVYLVRTGTAVHLDVVDLPAVRACDERVAEHDLVVLRIGVGVGVAQHDTAVPRSAVDRYGCVGRVDRGEEHDLGVACVYRADADMVMQYPHVAVDDAESTGSFVLPVDVSRDSFQGKAVAEDIDLPNLAVAEAVERLVVHTSTGNRASLQVDVVLVPDGAGNAFATLVHDRHPAVCALEVLQSRCKVELKTSALRDKARIDISGVGEHAVAELVAVHLEAVHVGVEEAVRDRRGVVQHEAGVVDVLRHQRVLAMHGLVGKTYGGQETRVGEVVRVFADKIVGSAVPEVVHLRIPPRMGGASAVGELDVAETACEAVPSGHDDVARHGN